MLLPFVRSLASLEPMKEEQKEKMVLSTNHNPLHHSII
ncbi:BH0125 [Halalkalibacterium halodurans C-125]|jgi:hypothetical protein|uniref:BH0125 protein n=1 Tax=Halalkalibacterium halodurans (strain ATCC BAA-125 / DSM 18197 / FERM 7344 / JCM 9153 / C-125) TaxID=272558 RepID=Q9KGE1_HALH5|nr:BH0125 [Halalkalibacterium halodurans C-125]